MGDGNWDSNKWTSYKSEKKIDTAKSVKEIYSTENVKEMYLPYGITRESCDSNEHPESTPVAIGLDVSNSMDEVVNNTAKNLGTLVGDIYERSPITDPQIMFGAIDDYFATPTPLQVTQFESDIRIAKQLMELKFIAHGGGNGFESYPLFWYFLQNHTQLDCYNKRHKKGFIFTIGDDGYPQTMSKKEIFDIFGDELVEDVYTKDLVSKMKNKFHLFHFCLEEGYTYRNRDFEAYQNLLGSNAIKISDYRDINKIIHSILELYSGKKLNEILNNIENTNQIKRVEKCIKKIEFKDNPNKDIII